ncbi:hypothetical protein E4U21_007332 [Claviceps maximensis]|nr:hypothetical protein E4U21_007332 [Claviceps maximensis]
MAVVGRRVAGYLKTAPCHPPKRAFVTSTAIANTQLQFDQAGLVAASSPTRLGLPQLRVRPKSPSLPRPDSKETATPSVTYIADEPDFQPFSSSENTNAGRRQFDESILAEQENDSNDNNKSQRWPSPRRGTLTIGPAQNWVHDPPSSHHEAAGMVEEMSDVIIHYSRLWRELASVSWNVTMG